MYERLRRYEVGIEKKSGKSQLLFEKASSVREKLASAQNDILVSTKRIDDIDREIRRAEAYGQKNGERLDSLRSQTEGFRTEIDELSKKIADYEYMTGEHRKKVLDTFKDLSDMRQNMGSLSAQKQLLKERLGEIKKDMENIRARRDGLRGDRKSVV